MVLLTKFVSDAVLNPRAEKMVLTQRYPKHAVLKMPISRSTKEVKSPPCAQHIFIDLATCHYSLTLTPYRCRSTLSQSYPKFRHFSKFSFFGSCTGKSTFSAGPKIPVFQRPRTRRILELQTCKQVFCDLQIL